MHTYKRMASTNFILLWFKHFYDKLWYKFCNIFSYADHINKTDCKTSGQSKDICPIPEVKGLPLVGTIFDLIAAGGAPKLHLYIDKRHANYGHIFREHLGGTQDCIFVSSASLMRAVFMHEGPHPRHPLPDAWLLYNKENKCRRGLFFMDGKEWLHNRRVLSRLLLNGNLDWMYWHVRQQTNKLIQRWLAQSEEHKTEGFVLNNLVKQLYRWSIDVIISIMFGETSDLESLDIQMAVEDFANNVHKIFESTSPLMSFPPKLAKTLGMKIWHEFAESVDQVLSKGCNIIDIFLERTSSYPGGLLEKLKEAEVSLEMIKRIFVDLVIAAGDTTAYSTTWALYLLSEDDKLQEKLCNEYKSNIQKTPLLQGFIKETLRLYPVAPFIGRYMPQECMLNKYHVKKDSLVILSLFTAGREEKYFPDPLKVMPERWLRSEQTGEFMAVHDAYATIPFSRGNRSCIGRQVAQHQMHYIIAEVCKHFQLKCQNTSPIQSVLKLVTVPNQPIELFVTKRYDLKV